MSNIDLKDSKTQDELLSVMKEISHAMHNIEVARDQVKEIIDAAASTFGLEKKLLRKVSRLYHKRNISEFEIEAAEVTGLYTQITHAKPAQ